VSNPFVLPVDEYKRDVDPIGQYKAQAAKYLSISKGISIEKAVAVVATMFEKKMFPRMRNPEVTYLNRKPNGDREKVTATLSSYIYTALNNRRLIAPTMTTYDHPEDNPSFLVEYVDTNVAGRNVAKKAMFAAKAVKDYYTADYKNKEQKYKKTKNNSLSGAQVSGGTPLNNKTAHSTLTSNCRTTAGYGSANNEKFLSGNRHYFHYNVVMNNITSICTITDLEAINAVIVANDLYVPTVKDVMECIRYSTDLYWCDSRAIAYIEAYVMKLTPMQRAAFLYVGDFYHFAKHNKEFAKELITKLSTKITDYVDSPLSLIKSLDEEHVNHARAVCKQEANEMTKIYKDYEGDPRLGVIAATAKNITDTITSYSEFIRAFWTTPNVPAEVAFFPESMRRSALTGDTDSTIFTVQEWVWWYFDSVEVAAGSTVSDTMIFLAAQTITHVLARMSANFGIVKERLFQIAMKNEYKFDAYVPTNVAKHYFATKNIQEGIILFPEDYEIKGVHLKNSNSPKQINQTALDMMKSILAVAKSAKKLRITDYLTQIANIERDIQAKIAMGDTTYLRLAEIKNPQAYSKTPMQSPYMHHVFWNTVFGPKYGTTPEPPYATVRLSSVLDNPRRTAEYLDGIEDKDLADRFRAFLTENNKLYIPSLMIPVSILSVSGMPKELLQIVDIRHIVGDITKVFYLIMETLGFYLSGDTLISDLY
jgi:hypothetical protein